MNTYIRLFAVLFFLTSALALPHASALPEPLESGAGKLSLSSGTLPAGVYQVTFRLQIDQLEQSVNTLATLRVGVPGYPNLAVKTITPLLFTAPDTPCAVTFNFDNFAPQRIETAVEINKDKSIIPKLSVAGISITPCRQLCIATVWPGKILYHTNEAANALVTVYNGTYTPQQAKLRCTLESDLNHQRLLPEIPLTLAPGERRDVRLLWNTGKEEYGFALAAALLDARGQVVSTEHEYFSVADNLWKVALTQSGRGCSVPFGAGGNESAPVSEIQKEEKQLEAELAKPFAPVYWNYSNYNEYYAWSPDDFFNMAPDTEYWYSGTGNYTYGKHHLQRSIEWLHRRGMRATAYLNPFSIGYGGDKAYTLHPEWFVYDQNGQLSIGSYYEKKLEVGSKISEEGPWKLQLSPYALGLNVNISTLEAVDAQVAQIVKAQKMFNWDGVRFDNGIYGAYGFDFHGKKIDGGDPKTKDLLEARAWAHMRDSLRQQLGPGFVVGDNNDYQFRDRCPAGWDESCRKGQLLMEEVPRSSWDKQSATNRWQDFMAYYHKSGEAVRALGGHHLIIGFDYQYPIDHLYLTLCTYAGRSHPYSYQYHSDTLPLGNYAQFITRYSALLWDIELVKALPDPERKITVNSPQPLWWKEYASIRKSPDGVRQYILHLVNPPVQERIYSDPANKAPLPQTNITVTLTVEKDEQLSQATLLTADPVMTETKLPIKRQGNKVSVTVPGLYFWDVLVLQ